MKLPNLSKLGNDIWKWTSKHSPEILTGMGIMGMISSTVLAVKVTPKAMDLIEDKKKEEKKETLEPVEIVKVVWKCYIPSTATTIISAACIIGASSINHKRNTALATAFSLSESAFKTYQEKVIETIGEKKEQAVRDEIAKDMVNRDPVINKEVIITGKGETLCYDPITARYFKCDIEKIRRVENELNKELFSSMFVSLNELYYKLGLRGSELGDELGWNVDSGGIEFDFSSQLADDGTPCLVIGYHVAPRYDYRKLM